MSGESVQALAGLARLVLLDGVRSQFEELCAVALPDTTGVAIGQIGLERLLPGDLRGGIMAGRALRVFQD